MSEVTKTKETKDNNTVAFICLLSGWCDKVPNLHWSAPGDNTHLRLDEVKDFLDETRDAIAAKTKAYIKKARTKNSIAKSADSIGKEIIDLRSAGIEFNITGSDIAPTPKITAI